ncbi:hypothetical protein GCM10027051_03590 [Niabella terrae]
MTGVSKTKPEKLADPSEQVVFLDATGLDDSAAKAALAEAVLLDLAFHFPLRRFLTTGAGKAVDLPANIQTVYFSKIDQLFRKRAFRRLIKQNSVKNWISFDQPVRREPLQRQILFITAPGSARQRVDPVPNLRVICLNAALKTLFIKANPQLEGATELVEWLVPEVSGHQNFNISLFKDQFNEGREYFIYTDFDAGTGSIMTLLRAFSIFKRMQQSNWKLVLVLRNQHPETALQITEKLLTYKYRQDVQITDASALGDKLRAAYGLVSQIGRKQSPLEALEALQAGIPVVMGPHPAARELLSDALCFAEDDQPEAMARALMDLYKSESLRSRYIRAGSALEPEIRRRESFEKIRTIFSGG